MPVTTALLIRNSGKSADLLAGALARLKSGGFEIISPACDSAETACRLIEAHASMVDAIIVAGGDGTVNGAAPGLLTAGKRVGVLPLGTANDLARTLGLPPEPERAAEAIVAGHVRAIDVGLANGKPFFNVASIGLGAELARSMAGAEKKRFGRLAYPLKALRAVTDARTFDAEIEAEDGVTRVRSYQIAVGNGRYYGGGVAVRHDARIDDGRLDVHSLGPGSLWKTVVLAPLFKWGRHVRWREVHDACASRICIRTPTEQSVNLDGEVATTTPVELSVKRGALEVFVPKTA